MSKTAQLRVAGRMGWPNFSCVIQAYKNWIFLLALALSGTQLTGQTCILSLNNNSELTTIFLTGFCPTEPNIVLNITGTAKVGGKVDVPNYVSTLTINGTLDFDDNSDRLEMPETATLIVGTLTASGVNGNNPIITFGNTKYGKDDLAAINLAGGASALAPLPIELTVFTGKRIHHSIQLYWRTVSEKNNDYMEVQRSKDGKTFEKLSIVKGQGDRNVPTDYRYMDNEPMPGVNYYRLKQVDFDGKSEYHKVIAVLFKDQEDKAQGITLFPSVVSEQLNFALSEEAGNDGEIYISDLSGRIVLRMPFERGMQQGTIPVPQLSHGIYILVVQTGRELKTARFVKQ